MTDELNWFGLQQQTETETFHNAVAATATWQ